MYVYKERKRTTTVSQMNNRGNQTRGRECRKSNNSRIGEKERNQKENRK
jgi:hypothetical protein